MQSKTLLSLAALATIAAALYAPSAEASSLITQQTKTHLQQDRAHFRRARRGAAQAAINAAGARELETLTPSTTPVTPPAGMDQALAAQMLADGVVTAEEVACVQARADHLKGAAHIWARRVRRLGKRLRRLVQIDEWAQRGKWQPLMAIAGHTYGVSPTGLYRMMMFESGGRRYANGTYKGLFQYCSSAWTASWNPWRHASIFDGWAQIRATALAISKGMGPSQWPNTYPRAF